MFLNLKTMNVKDKQGRFLLFVLLGFFSYKWTVCIFYSSNEGFQSLTVLGHQSYLNAHYLNGGDEILYLAKSTVME